MGAWKEITTDHLTGHVIAKDYFKAWGSFAGLLYLVVLVPAVRILSHEELSAGPGMFLVASALGFQALKEGSTYLNRKTADDSGNPLMQDGTQSAPAEPVIPTTPPAGQPVQ